MAEPPEDGAVRRVGQVVRSRAGRDAGQWYVVLSRDGERYVLVADGRLRKARRPKRKNVRHLAATAHFSERVANLAEQGRLPADDDVQRLLAELRAAGVAEAAAGGAEAGADDTDGGQREGG